MANLVVVSRTQSIARRLHPNHTVRLTTVDDALPAEGTPTATPPDVIIIDLGEPHTSIQVLQDLRHQGHRVPVLLIAGHQPGWAGVGSANRPDVQVAQLPITTSGLDAAIAQLLAPPTTIDLRHDPAVSLIPQPSQSPSGSIPSSPHLRRSPSGSAPDGPHRTLGFDWWEPDATDGSPILAPAAGRHSALPTAPAATALATRKRPVRKPRRPAPATSTRTRISASAQGAEVMAWSATTNPLAIVSQLISEVTDRVADLTSVADAATHAAELLTDKTGADAGAALIADGSVWRVSGGIGLRPLERRLVLEAGHWLVSEVAVKNTTVVLPPTPAGHTERPELMGAPLAHWPHVAALALPELRSVILIARGPESGPFHLDELAAITPSLSKATASVRTALQIRQLARLLAPLRDLEETGLNRHS